MEISENDLTEDLCMVLIVNMDDIVGLETDLTMEKMSLYQYLFQTSSNEVLVIDSCKVLTF